MEFWSLSTLFIVIVIIVLIYQCCIDTTKRQNAYRKPLSRVHDENILVDGLVNGRADGKKKYFDDFLKLNQKNDPSKKIDLHGLTSWQATIILDQYLPRTLSYGQSFEVITGRGNNSVNGAVLFPHVKEKLEDTYPRDWIRSANKNGSWIITGGGASSQWAWR